MKQTKELKRQQQHQHQLLQIPKHGYLIPGLPDEIAIDCLVRLPYRFHSDLKSVCRGWRNLVAHPSFYRERQKAGTAENLVCLVQALATTTTTEPPDSVTDNIVKEVNEEEEENEGKRQLRRRRHCPPLYGLIIYNATDDTWQRMMPTSTGPNYPHGIPLFCQCVALPSSGKLLILGGWDPTTLESVPDVYVFDFIRGGGWRRGAPMSVARSFFACAAVGPCSVYVAGGHDNQKNALRSAEVYDTEADEWRILPPMAKERDECQGLSYGDGDARFWVVSGYGTEVQGRFHSDAECYDPVLASWSTVDGVWPFSNASPRATTTTSSKMWWFGGGVGLEERDVVKEYDSKEERWKVVASIPNSLMTSSPCVAPLRGGGDIDRIFVMGSGGEGDHNGAFILETGICKWTRVHTPTNFSGFAYSASSLPI